MNDAVCTIDPGPEWPEWPELPPAAKVLVAPMCVRDVEAELKAAEESRIEMMRRGLSSAPPYLYRGRKGRCHFPSRKMKWRKG